MYVSLGGLGTLVVSSVLVLSCAARASDGTIAAQPSGVIGAVALDGASRHASPAPSRSADSETSCPRRVKVVYAGYGEAERMGCGAVVAGP